jgi:hypothetical protein
MGADSSIHTHTHTHMYKARVLKSQSPSTFTVHPPKVDYSELMPDSRRIRHVSRTSGTAWHVVSKVSALVQFTT